MYTSTAGNVNFGKTYNYVYRSGVVNSNFIGKEIIKYEIVYLLGFIDKDICKCVCNQTVCLCVFMIYRRIISFEINLYIFVLFVSY